MPCSLRPRRSNFLSVYMEDVFGKDEVFQKDSGIHAPWISLRYDENGNYQEMVVEENVMGWAEKGKAK